MCHRIRHGDLTLNDSPRQRSEGAETETAATRKREAAFSGPSLSVLQILSYAGSQSNVGGSTWYANVKATQVLAKDAFDAINNQVAFAP